MAELQGLDIKAPAPAAVAPPAIGTNAATDSSKQPKITKKKLIFIGVCLVAVIAFYVANNRIAIMQRRNAMIIEQLRSMNPKFDPNSKKPKTQDGN